MAPCSYGWGDDAAWPWTWPPHDCFGSREVRRTAPRSSPTAAAQRERGMWRIEHHSAISYLAQRRSVSPALIYCLCNRLISRYRLYRRKETSYLTVSAYRMRLRIAYAQAGLRCVGHDGRRDLQRPSLEHSGAPSVPRCDRDSAETWQSPVRRSLDVWHAWLVSDA